MSLSIQFTPVPGTMKGHFTQVPEFPGESFTAAIPEIIGDAVDPCHPVEITAAWTHLGQGIWESVGSCAQRLSYRVLLTPYYDTVDVAIELTNEGTTPWSHSLAFSCFNAASSTSVSDFECVRHWGRKDGQFKRLVELARQFSARPAVQTYSVVGAPPVAALPFAAYFQATSPERLEGWLAIRSIDGQRLIASVSKPALFLFQNSEYSCIHSCPSFGALQPGQTGTALTRLYFVDATLEDWYQRMREEMGP